MKILVVGGTHGDERTGIDVVMMLRSCKVKKIDTLIANPRATKMYCRFTETDLNRSFRVVNPASYEEIRAQEISETMGEYDIVLEFHNTNSKGTCIILTSQKPSEMQLKVAAHFGFKRIVIAPPGGNSLSSISPQKTLSFEISRSQAHKYSADYFVKKIIALLNGPKEVVESDLEVYKLANRKVMKSELAAFGMAIDEFADFVAFDSRQLERLDLEAGTAPFLVGGYGVVNPDFAFNVVKLEGRYKDQRRLCDE